MKKAAGLPFEPTVSSTELFENRHWKLDLLGTKDYHNSMVQVSDVGDICCSPGGERPLIPSLDLNWSFMLVLSGRGEIHHSKRRMSFRTGALLAVPPRSEVSLQVTEGPIRIYRFLIQDSGSLRDLFSQDISEPEVLHPREPELLKQCFERTFQLLKQQNARTPLMISSEAFIFLSEIKRQCMLRDVPESFEQVCNEVSCFPTRHYTLEKLAAACRMSVRSFQRRFARERHCSPQTFIMVCRLTVARRILRSSMLPIQDIAQRCRFNSMAQFSKSFKKYIGMSPREYRKQFYRRNAEYYQLKQEKSGCNFWNLLPVDRITPIQRQILWCRIDNPRISTTKIAALLHIPSAKVRDELQELQKIGIG